MAGLYLEITRDTATPRIDKAIAAMDDDGLQLMLDDIGEYVLRATRERGDREVSPDGEPFADLDPAYERWKRKKRPGVGILRFDFHMMGDQLSHQVVGDAVYIGTNAVYGAVQHFHRPWLGLSDEDEDEVLAIAHDHLSGMFSD